MTEFKIIHLAASGIRCSACRKDGNCSPEHTFNVHPHGTTQYGHMDLQMVLQAPQKDICCILNALRKRVQSGKSFKAGDIVEVIFLDCPVRLDAFQECDRTVLRVIIPDGNNRFPEDSTCDYPYSLQTHTMEQLEQMGGEVT